MWTVLLPAVVIAYLVGSIPFGVIIARAHGKDLRAIGSGNIGATNVSRALGRRWGYTCFVLDVLKGLVPMLTYGVFAMPYVAQTVRGPLLTTGWLLVGVAAILGHIFPIYLGFKGGKAVSTSFGVALGLWPYFTISALIAFAVWVATVLTWRYISLASICAALVFPVSLIVGVLVQPHWRAATLWPLLVAATLIPLLVIALHRENIQRLLAGTEAKIRRKHTSP
ncbi:MAG: glycerol-3-phosphate 1-O-acyltransferase PlsY [Sedimentisphaerales bacterium]|nr:glycerol-3-phosphate 1-O-acyltransferase PlsY [Sedimentisphaerales bacterium]